MYTASQGRLIGFRRPCVIYLHDLRVFYPNKLDKAGKLYYRGQYKNQSIKAAYFENGKAKSATIEQPFFITKSTGKKIELVHQPHENYGIGGSFTLVDGMKGNTSKFGRDWLGFWGKDMNATIDLGKTETISKISINTLSSEGSWIYYPKSIGILVSKDGYNWDVFYQDTINPVTNRGYITNASLIFVNENNVIFNTENEKWVYLDKPSF